MGDDCVRRRPRRPRPPILPAAPVRSALSPGGRRRSPRRGEGEGKGGRPQARSRLPPPAAQRPRVAAARSCAAQGTKRWAGGGAGGAERAGAGVSPTRVVGGRKRWGSPLWPSGGVWTPGALTPHLKGTVILVSAAGDDS